MNKPVKMSPLNSAFGLNVVDSMPKYQDIPEQFKHGYTPQNKLVNKLFFNGGKIDWLVTKPEIDRTDAIRQIKATLGSWEPKHEHKEAAVAMMLAEWFEPFTEQDVETKC